MSKNLFYLLILIVFFNVSCNTERKPNIIFILADDLSWGDLSINGQDNFETPNIDLLASNGMIFRNAYSGAPECAPSRASLLTGKHMGHARIRANRSVRGQDHLLNTDTTIAEILKNSGYINGFFGKWGVGLPGTSGIPDKQGFDVSFGYYDQLRAHGFYPDYLMSNNIKVDIPENRGFDMDKLYRYNREPVQVESGNKNQYDDSGTLIPSGVNLPGKERYSEYLIREQAIKFIKENKDNNFFMYYATQLPHGPVIAPSIAKYKDKEWPQKNKEWASMMKELDNSVGLILKTLKELKLDKNTLIFFASDNGYSQYGYFGRKMWEDDPLFKNKGPWPYGKFIPRDGGMRIPFFVYWPELVKPQETNHIVSLYDVFATLADLTDYEDKNSDGLSFLPLMKGKNELQKEHDYLYWEGGTLRPHAQSVRMGDHFAYRSHPDSVMELYNVTNDPACSKDLSDDITNLVKKAKELMESAHVDSRWYINPGETAELIQKKREDASKEENRIPQPMRANSSSK